MLIRVKFACPRHGDHASPPLGIRGDSGYGNGRQRIAAWLSLGVFGLLSLNSMFRIYLAATAQPRVTIGGGVAGNAAMVALFAVLAIVPWWMLRRHAHGGASRVTSQHDEGSV